MLSFFYPSINNTFLVADGVRFIKNPDGTVALEIPKCKPEDAGKYTLRVKNPDGGTAESSAPVEGKLCRTYRQIFVVNVPHLLT